MIQLVLAKEQREVTQAVIAAAKIVRGIEPESNTENTIRLLRQVRERAERGLHLFDGLISWEQQSASQTIRLTELLKEVIFYHRMAASRKGLQIRMELPADQLVMADRAMLVFVSRHLLGNAIRYAPAGSMVLISGKVVDNMLSVTYQDQGPGIPLNLRDRLFNNGGLGLGICRAMLGAMKGHIRLENIEEHGAAITYELPIRTDA